MVKGVPTSALRAACLLLANAVIPQSAAGQGVPEIRILTVVNYISGKEIYLASGSDHGIRAADTLPVYDGEGEAAKLLGTLTFLSVTERRSVAAFAGTPFPVARSDLMYLGLPHGLAQDRDREAHGKEDSDPVGSGLEQASGERSPRLDPGTSSQAEPSPPIRFRGRASFDVDALQTITRWGDSPEQEARRTFSTPTFRFQLRGQNLPGGFSLGTNMRLSHRSSTDGTVQPVTSLRFYQFDLEKEFEGRPLQLHLGRFHNPFDDFSGYFDGLMVHYGESGFGAGLAFGFEPEFWNQGMSTDRRKVSGFMDYSAKGEESDYSGALSFNTIRSNSGSTDRTYLGLSQRVHLGSIWIRNRLQVDRKIHGSAWTVSRLQFDASAPLSKGLSAHAGWRRWRPYYPGLPASQANPLRNRTNIGFSYWVESGGISGDLSSDSSERGEDSRTVSLSAHLRRTRILGLGFSGMASYWTRGEYSSLLLSPEVRREFGSLEVRGAYRLYEISGGLGEARHQTADMALSFRLGSGISCRLQGFVRWGNDLTSNRLLASLWKSF